MNFGQSSENMNVSGDLESFHGVNEELSKEENAEEIAQNLRVTHRADYQMLREFETADDFQAWWAQERSLNMKKKEECVNDLSEEVIYYK